MFPKSLISFSLLLLLLIPVFGKVKGSRYGVYEGKIRIVFHLTESRDFKVFTLENPRRIVIDIYGERSVSRLRLPADMRYRVGRHPWGVRIVLLYPRNFSLKYFKLRKPDRIVLDIYREGRELYAELIKIIGGKTKAGTSEDRILGLIKKARSRPLVYEDRVIVIDAGHGGKDPGAIGYGGIREKDINLAIALRVAEYLRRDGRFKVVLTRKGDYVVELFRRAEIALLKSSTK